MDFTYNASALGAGGVVQSRSRTTIIPSLASVALAPTGGEGSSVETNYFSRALSFSRAETRVKGFQQNDNIFTTYADVFVSDLSVFGKLTIALMQATLISTRDISEPFSRFQLNALYRDISVDGKEVIAEMDIEISSCPTYDDFEKLLESKKKLRKGHDRDFVESFGTGNVDELLRVVRGRHAVQGSIVRKLEHRGGLPAKQHSLPIPGVGTAYFGELMLKPERRRVNLLRMKLDTDTRDEPEPVNESPQKRRMLARASVEERPSKDGGSMTIASVEGNGSPILP